MDHDRGNAPAEFVLVGALLIAVVLGILQVALVIHLRHQIVMAATEGARVASLLDVSHAEALHHTTEVLEASVGEGVIQYLSLQYSSVDGAPTIEVEVRASYPALGMLTLPGELIVSAHAPLFVVP